MTTMTNAARDRLAKGELSIGVGLRQARTVDIAAAMKTAGYDWLFLDLEHGTMSEDMAVQIAMAANGYGIAPMVRVPNRQYDMATRVLDGGAWGIVMPHVDTPEEAREVADRLRYPPQGHRSVAGNMPQFAFQTMPLAESASAINKNLLVVVMLETPRAIENADAIAAVPGVDVLLVGANDLAMEMGIPQQLGNDRMINAYQRLVAACKKHNKWAGLGGVYTEDLITKYIGMGARFVLAGGDMAFMMAAAQARTKFLREVKL
jgi:2-keto-3-deoxy-L-rhamnonate aldolase RhmA